MYTCIFQVLKPNMTLNLNKLVSNAEGYFNIEYYPMTRNIEDLNFEDEINRLYFSTDKGVVKLNVAEDKLQSKIRQNDYVVKLKGSYVFSNNGSNIYMTVHVEEINENELIFSIVNFQNMEPGQERSITKSLLRLPSTQVNLSTKFLNTKLNNKESGKWYTNAKHKRYSTEGLILSKSLIAKRLETNFRDPSDLKFFIQEEVYLVKQKNRASLSAFKELNVHYKLDLIKDLEMMHENNFHQTLSRFDELESAQGMK